MNSTKLIPVLAVILLLTSIPSFGAVKLIPLISFDETNGSLPHCNLVQGKNGDFYGTTSGSSAASYAGGVFKISSQGHFANVASFHDTNGGVPWDGLILGPDGSFYGTARAGGINNSGTVFRMAPHGKMTAIAFFDGTNGAGPVGLVNGVDGNFYGITESGGDKLYLGDGTVFKMSPEGNLMTLFEFGGTNGSGPWSLVQGDDGNLYGTTLGGGSFNAGTVFRITTNGDFRMLWEFDGTNGGEPQSVVLAMDGNLYGSTYFGGPNYNGTIFKLTPDGRFSTLHSFSQRSSYDVNADGSNPTGKLMLGRDGCIYGGTQNGGTNLFADGTYGGVGTLFKISTTGDFTTLCSFGTYTNFYKTGSFPNGLIQDQKGDFFGTTYFGGDVGYFGEGTVFKLATVRPVLAITKPHQNARLSDSAATIIGKTKAKVETAITNVTYQLNGSDWTAASTTNNWTNWIASVTLAPGANVFRVYSLDANGDTSRTNILKLRCPRR